MKEIIDKARKNFKFKYIGGGYFRDSTVEKGKKAELRHEDEVIKEFCKELNLWTNHAK